MVGTGDRRPMEDFGNSPLISTGSLLPGVPGPLTGPGGTLSKESVTTATVSSAEESCSMALMSIFLSVGGLMSSMISSSSEVVSSSSSSKLEGSRQGSSPYFLK